MLSSAREDVYVCVWMLGVCPAAPGLHATAAPTILWVCARLGGLLCREGVPAALFFCQGWPDSGARAFLGLLGC